MRLFAASLFGAIICGGAAMACPSFHLSSGSTAYMADQLLSPQSFATNAGGENRLESCNLGVLGSGQFRSAPDFSFDLSQTTGREVEFSVNSGCDSALLINAADGTWHFDDDSNGNLDPLLRITQPSQLEGRVDVWVGTFSGGGCPATLTVQSFVTGVATPAPAPVPVPVPAPAPAPAPAPVAACPNPALVGPSLTLTGPQMLTPQAYVAQVTGGSDVSNCPGINAYGFASQAPQFTLFLSQMEPYQFTVETVSDCDPTLIIRDAMGQWHFNDDGPNGLQPRLQIAGGALNGRVDVWVGTFGGSTCQGTINFTTQPIAAPAPAPAPVAGCPNSGLQGTPIYTSGSELYSPDDFQVIAGGPTNLAGCGIPGVGNYSAQPSFSFFLSGMQDYGRLEIEGSSSCDTTLLVRTPDGQWHFDDDSNGNFNPRLDLVNTFALNGRVDVWVGTYGGGTCPATIEMETWHN